MTTSNIIIICITLIVIVCIICTTHYLIVLGEDAGKFWKTIKEINDKFKIIEENNKLIKEKIYVMNVTLNGVFHDTNKILTILTKKK